MNQYTKMIKQEKYRSIVFLLVPKFSMIAFATAIEVLRIANRMLATQAYKWRLASIDGDIVKASNGVTISVDTSLQQERQILKKGKEYKPSMALVCSGIEVEKFNDKTTLAWIREEYNKGVAVGGLCTGAYIIAQAGLLSNKKCAIHWENMPAFQEKFPKADVRADLFEVDDNIYTCAGGTAALDMMLSLVMQDHGEKIVNAVCEQALTDRMRNATDRQRLPLKSRLGVHNARVLAAVEIMEANIAEPMNIKNIAKKMGMSRRQMERVFQKYMEKSPAKYYLEIRLERAKNLMNQSSMPVVDIAVACGFVSASHFSKCYKKLYGHSPQKER